MTETSSGIEQQRDLVERPKLTPKDIQAGRERIEQQIKQSIALEKAHSKIEEQERADLEARMEQALAQLDNSPVGKAYEKLSGGTRLSQAKQTPWGTIGANTLQGGQSLANILIHPIQTTKAVGQFFMSPRQSIKQVASMYKDEWNYSNGWGKIGVVWRGAFEVVFGAKGAGTISKVGKLGYQAGKLGKLGAVVQKGTSAVGAVGTKTGEIAMKAIPTVAIKAGQKLAQGVQTVGEYIPEPVKKGVQTTSEWTKRNYEIRPLDKPLNTQVQRFDKELAIMHSEKHKGISSKISEERLQQVEVKGENPTEKVKELYRIAEESKSDFNEILDQVGKETGALEIHNTKVGGINNEGVLLKNYEIGLNKVLSHPSPDKYKRLTDVLRGTLVYKDVPTMKQAITELARHTKVKSISVVNRLDRSGINDMLINIRLKNGHVTELQLHIPEIRKTVTEGIIAPENVLPKSAFNFSKEEISIVESLKEAGQGTRILDSSINLPKFGKPVSTHQVYEIMRAMPAKKTPSQEILGRKLESIVGATHSHALKLYSERTGLSF